MQSTYLVEVESSREIDPETRILLKHRIGDLVRDTLGGSAVPHVMHLGTPKAPTPLAFGRRVIVERFELLGRQDGKREIAIWLK